MKSTIRFTKNKHIDKNLNILLQKGSLLPTGKGFIHFKPDDFNLGYLHSKLQDSNSKLLGDILSLKNESAVITTILENSSHSNGDKKIDQYSKRKYQERLTELRKELTELLTLKGVTAEVRFLYTIMQGTYKFNYIDENYVRIASIFNKADFEGFDESIKYSGPPEELFDSDKEKYLFNLFGKYNATKDILDDSIATRQKEKIGKGVNMGIVTEYSNCIAILHIIGDIMGGIVNDINRKGYTSETTIVLFEKLKNCVQHKDYEGIFDIVTSVNKDIQKLFMCLLYAARIGQKTSEKINKLVEFDPQTCLLLRKSIENNATAFEISIVSNVKKMFNTELRFYYGINNININDE